MEVDFIIQREGKIVPVEMKAGEHTKSKNLDSFIASYKPEYAVRLSTKNFGMENGKKLVPLYASFCV